MKEAAGVEGWIHRRIAREGPVAFPQFMEWALGAPGTGFYTRAEAAVGRGGDFVTSPSLSPVFGRTLGRVVPRLVRATGVEALRVIDAGAGDGHLAAALAAVVRPPIELVLVEPGPALRRRAAARVAAAGVAVLALELVSELAALPPRPGLVLANELFDALPVRRLRREREGLKECFVASAGGRLVERWLPCPQEPDLEDLPAGKEVCIAPGCAGLLEALSMGIERGLILIIDYGSSRGQIRAREGVGNPLRGFHRGALADDLLAEPGTIDLTAHVDFSALRRAAVAAGLRPLFYCEQTYLMLALGILEDAGASAARRLFHPEDLGGAFHCLALLKGLDAAALDLVPLRDHLAWLSEGGGGTGTAPKRAG